MAKILVVEDEANIASFIQRGLRECGHEAVVATDGEQGWLLAESGGFDCLLLDVMMPKKDGFTLAQEIRQANTEIPIIFLTARALKDDILEGFKIGADD